MQKNNVMRFSCDNIIAEAINNASKKRKYDNKSANFIRIVVEEKLESLGYNIEEPSTKQPNALDNRVRPGPTQEEIDFKASQDDKDYITTEDEDLL